MFDEILKMVKDHLGNDQQLSSAVPDEHRDALHNEVASQVTDGLKYHATTMGGAGGLLSSLQKTMTSGSPVVNAIEGGLVSSLASKFGLSPLMTGAIAAVLPGILQKFLNKANDPNDSSITKEGIDESLSKTIVTDTGNLAANV